MRRRTAAAVAAAAVCGAVTWWGPSPTWSLGSQDAPSIWGAERPADLVEIAFPPGLEGSQDGAAQQFADLGATRGPLDADGCGALPVGPSPFGGLPVVEPGDTEIDFNNTISFLITAARLCDGPGGPSTLLDVRGIVSDPGEVGALRIVIARPAADQPFGRSAIEYSTPACMTIGSLSGFPGDATDVQDYVIQGWNFAGDPDVGCASRSLTQEPTTTTSSAAATTSTAPATSTTSITSTTTTAPVVPSTGAQPIQGSPTYAG